ncbi:hypothetical protein G6F46_004475 [Rhizopus delemar]|nr:hypothetical protein G6F55_005360 [Rhizopus delemar]KAG1497368.1 hypothetical protein G6F54_005818 [Rhizopus delemar]KAG1513992.1 hypothetical protein G6F53_004019 [Rhizopus delemar]KAG1546597.1 hypothetical protein G6F51_004790 [Rhizopus arrhizus]KAG1617710.1 hypothetical protein G6F46_004475 [Rhizopus delemar]
MVFTRLKGHPYLGAFLSALPWMPVAIFFVDHGYSYARVSGRSMQPTFNPDSNMMTKDIILLDKWSTTNHKFKRGDVVLLTSPDEPEKMITKRIIGLPGDIVQHLRKKDKQVRIPQGHCWIEGDEAFHSKDSNSFGPVPIGLISAKAKYILWPPSRFGPVPDRAIHDDRVKKNAFRPEEDERGGMCFCLKRANRLIPNRFSFPLTERGQGRVRLAENDEERGLLSEESDAEVIDDGYRYEEDELQSRLVDEEDEFVDEMSSGSDSEYSKYWIDWFLDSKGNEYFCEVDEEYILDRFNLTGLNLEVQQYYLEALDMITDNLDEEKFDDKARDQIERAARHLYGLIHARFIITSRGLIKMLEKYKKAEFGRCPRVLCNLQPLLPVGLSDVPCVKTVKLYCPKCEDIYNPKSSRHASIDGAYFGTSFPHMLFQAHANYMPTKSNDRYEPRIFGFKIHHIAEQHRWQDRAREEYQKRITDTK